MYQPFIVQIQRSSVLCRFNNLFHALAQDVEGKHYEGEYDADGKARGLEDQALKAHIESQIGFLSPALHPCSSSTLSDDSYDYVTFPATDGL